MQRRGLIGLESRHLESAKAQQSLDQPGVSLLSGNMECAILVCLDRNVVGVGSFVQQGLGRIYTSDSLETSYQQRRGVLKVAAFDIRSAFYELL
jgi:hypothetical protein